MNFRDEVRKVINSSKYGVRYRADGKAFKDAGVVCSDIKLQETLKSMYNEAERAEALERSDVSGMHFMSFSDVQSEATKNFRQVLNCFVGNKKEISREKLRNVVVGKEGSFRDAVFNPSFVLGTPNDPSSNVLTNPNIYISPYEAMSLYSQKGIFETIINKKSKTILLNGFHIVNDELSQKQIDEVNASLERMNVKGVLSNAIRDALVYGGSLLFPIFKQDTGLTFGLDINQLIKLGILGKDSISHLVCLDRWNAYIIPQMNPTFKDFDDPREYIVPYLGYNLCGERCARIVTGKQAGFWGNSITQGWGVSDFVGYLRSGLNYKVAVQSLPLMIQQMSILARVVNVDGVLATEGSNALDSLVEQDTIRMRQISADNPVTMDVLGDLKSIERKFEHVPELIRLLRQDLSADAGIPEPMLFSSEKGNFASGDDTEGNLSKQWENVRMIHKEIESQCLRFAKLLVVNALGTGVGVLKALKSTKLQFDQPVIANAVDMSEIGKNLSSNLFNLVSAQIPIDIAVKMAYANASYEMKVPNTIIELLEKRQKDIDERDLEKFNIEMELQRAEVDQVKEQTNHIGDTVSSNGTGGSNVKKPKSEGYDRLEQKQHSKTRIGNDKRLEKMAKLQGAKE